MRLSEEKESVVAAITDEFRECCKKLMDYEYEKEDNVCYCFFVDANCVKPDKVVRFYFESSGHYDWVVVCAAVDSSNVSNGVKQIIKDYEHSQEVEGYLLSYYNELYPDWMDESDGDDLKKVFTKAAKYIKSSDAVCRSFMEPGGGNGSEAMFYASMDMDGCEQIDVAVHSYDGFIEFCNKGLE